MPTSTNLIEKLLKEKESKNINFPNKKENKEEKERKELEEKRQKLLEKIVSRADRKNKICLKNAFQKYYLKVKLMSVQNIIDNDKENVKKKKKKKVKKKKDEDNAKKNDENNKIEENTNKI